MRYSIVSFKSKIEKKLGQKLDKTKIKIVKHSRSEAEVILPAKGKLASKVYYIAEYEVDRAASFIKSFLDTGKADMREFWEIYGWKGETPEEWGGIWAFNSWEKMSRFLDDCRDSHREVGIQNVPNPLNESLVRIYKKAEK